MTKRYANVLLTLVTYTCLLCCFVGRAVFTAVCLCALRDV